MWKVEVMSKEMIKPSTPTPPHLRIHNLSWFDRTIDARIPTTTILFYPVAPPNAVSLIATSLAKTLSLFYPLAGRLNDGASVDCNDKGVELTLARAIADAPLSSLLDSGPDHYSLNTLLPSWNPELGYPLSVQVTTFNLCGGISIGCNFCHIVGDAHSDVNFIAAWAAASEQPVPCRPTFNAASLFPPPASDCGWYNVDYLTVIGLTDHGKWVVTKRFLFEESAISLLQRSSSITRVQAVIALIWRCCIRSSNKIKRKRCSRSMANIIVNMRGRSTLLDNNLYGNLFCFAAAFEDNLEADDVEEAKLRSEEKVSVAIKNVTEGEKLRRFQGGNEWSVIFEATAEAKREYGIGGDEDVYGYCFSSWTRFPFYEVDFGWGKPIWVAMGGEDCKNMVFPMVSAGGGIEAWVSPDKEDMVGFECDKEIVAYASSSK